MTGEVGKIWDQLGGTIIRVCCTKIYIFSKKQTAVFSIQSQKKEFIRSEVRPENQKLK